MKTIQTTSSCFCALALVLALSATKPARATTWASSGLGGGGTQNCLTIDPNDDSIVICASDISGIQRSSDGGKSWIGSNLGTPSSGTQKVACVAWSNDGSDTVYAGTGDSGSGGGFFASIDGGVEWTELSTAAQFCGNGTSLRWPRDTGNLIVSDQANSPKYLYAGTFNNGVMRSTDGGSTWTPIGLSSYEITGLAWDQAHASHLFVTTRGNNVWWTSTARSLASGTGTTGWTQLTGAPSYPEEALVLGSTLFVAGGTSNSYTSGGGLWSTSATSPGTFTKLGTSGSFTIPTDTTYTGLAGSGSGSTAVIYIAAANPTSNDTIIRSTDGGSTWAPVTLAGNVNYTIHDASGPQYWEDKANGPSYYLLGANSCGISNIQIDPSNSANVMVAAQSGFWGTANGTAASTSVAWYPYVGGYGGSGGLAVNEGTTIATDPNKPGRAYFGLADFSFLWSSDGGGSWQAGTSTGGGGTMGRGIWVDPVTSTVYLGKKGDNGASTPSDVFASSDPTTTGWTDLNLTPGASNDEEYGIGGARDSSGNVYIFACVAGPDAGLYRYQSTTGKWASVSSSITPDTGDNPLVTFAWTPGDSNVFVYEQGTGLWRGSNYGASGDWTKIWSTTSKAVGTGFVVADPVVAGQLYVSTTSGVYRFTGADSGTPTPTTMSVPANFSPGALALGNGTLYCCGFANSSMNGEMIAYAAPASSTSYGTISDSVNYPGQSNWPSCLAVSTAGTVFVAERDEGVMFGQPLFQDNFSNGAGNWTIDSGTWSIGGSGPDYYQESASGGGIANVSVSGSSSWSDYSATVDLTPLSFGSGTGSMSLSLYWQDSGDRYIAVLTNAGTGTIKEDSGGTQTTLASGSISGGFNVNTTYAVKFSVNSSGLLTLVVNGAQIAQATNTALTQQGTIGISTSNATGNFANVSVTQP